MADPFERNLGLDRSLTPDYQLPDLGFTDSLGIGFDEADEAQSYNIIQDLYLPYSESQQMDEEEWKSSVYYREGLEYRPGMNLDWAQSIAETFDQNQQYAQLHDRMSFGGEVGAFVGGMGKGLIDPINWVSFPVGIQTALAKQTGSKILGAALFGAMTNAAVETAIAPARAEQADILQTEYGFEQYLLDVGLSAGLGGVLGGLGAGVGALRRRGRPDSFGRTLNDEFDNIIAMINEVKGDLGRTIMLPVTDGTYTVELPVQANRLSKFIAFDSSGNLTTQTNVGEWQGACLCRV